MKLDYYEVQQWYYETVKQESPKATG